MAVATAAPVIASAASHAGPAAKLQTKGGPHVVANLTFSPRSSLARLDLRTGTVRPLGIGSFSSLADPKLSPSGRLAFVAGRCGSCLQRLTIVRGGRLESLTEATSVAWTKTGTLLTSAGGGEDTDISVVDANGRAHELEWLSRAAKRIAVETEKELVVSPNGRALVFSGEGSSEHHGNYIVDLLRHRLYPLAGDADDAPAFSPDGRTIVYQHVSQGGDWDLCLAQISLRAATDEHCLRAPGGNDRQPVFLPNGREIVFSSDRAARRNAISSLYLLNLRTGSVRRLTPGTYDAMAPTVAADGRSVVFIRRALRPLR